MTTVRPDSAGIRPEPDPDPGSGNDPGSSHVAAAAGRAARRLLPLLFVLYLVNYLDRVAISFAGPNGMSRDLGLTATMFGIAAGVFFAGYILLEVPSNLALHRFGARKWLTRIVATWGLVATATAFVPDFGTLVVVRVLLGLAEAGFLPGIVLYLTYWFPEAPRKRILALFFVALPVSTALGSIVATSIIQFGDGWFGLSGWRVMFLLTGLPAVLLAAAVWFLLPDRPADARWLTTSDRDTLEAALARERSAMTGRAEHSLRAALTSPRILTLAASLFGLGYGVYALGFFLPTIVAGFQQQYGITFTALTGGLITAVPYGVAAVAMTLWGRLAGNRVWHVVVPATVGALAIPVALHLGNPVATMVAVTVCACGVLCAVVAFWSLVTTHVTGVAAAAGIALVGSIGNLSGLTAPYLTGYLSDVTGGNQAGMWVVGCLVLSSAVLIGTSARRRVAPAAPGVG